jgi:WD40 repeat protein
VLSSLAFSPDGKFLATGGAVVEDAKPTSAEVVIWDAHTGDVANVVPHGFPNFPVCVTSLAFAPDGKTLAIGGGSAGDLRDDGKTTGQISLVPLESSTGK